MVAGAPPVVAAQPDDRRAGARPPKDEHNAVRFLIRGHVQNVGFRDFVVRRANRLGVRGWVRNRSDGTVEVLAAADGEVDALLEACRLGPNAARVEHVDVHPTQETLPRRGFRKTRQYEVVEDAAAQRYHRLGIDPAGEAFGPLHHAGLLDTHSPSSVDAARAFWREHMAVDIDPALHIAYENLTGAADPRVLPPTQYRTIQRLFNADKQVKRAYVDKGLYPYLVRTDRQPLNYLRRINGKYFDADNDVVGEHEVLPMLSSRCQRAIIKPSRSANGIRVNLLEFDTDGRAVIHGKPRTLADIERLYGGDFLVQQVIEQHSLMARVHPSSVNTLRMLTIRLGKDIHHLLTFARFGADGRVNDNAGTGGVCVGVEADGSFLPEGFDEHASVLARHPTTDVAFADLEPVPRYSEYVEFVRALHADLLNYDLVSWDIAVGKDGGPFFVEHNFAGAMWIYQLATRRPVFGELTDEVLAHVQHLRDVKAAA